MVGEPNLTIWLPKINAFLCIVGSCGIGATEGLIETEAETDVLGLMLSAGIAMDGEAEVGNTDGLTEGETDDGAELGEIDADGDVLADGLGD